LSTAADTLALAPRRLVLALDELEALRRLAGDVRLPADFRVIGELPSAVPATLAERGLVSGDPGALVVHASIVADLAVLSAPEVLVETVATVGQGSARQALRAVHALAGPLGASLVRAQEGAGVELSIFPAERVGREIARIVPQAARGREGAWRPEGIVALAALVELPIAAKLGGPAVVAQVAQDLQVSEQQRELALALARESTGVLQATLTVRTNRSRPHAQAWVGEVLWYATDGGWVGLAPEPGADGRTVVRLVPAEPAELPVWLAPLVGQALVEAAR